MYPTFPDVTLRELPFYEVKATLMQPCALQPSGTARFQDQKFSFYLSPSQASEIASSSYRDSNGRPEYKRQIQMRFSLLETSCEQDDNFPSSICVKVRTLLATAWHSSPPKLHFQNSKLAAIVVRLRPRPKPLLSLLRKFWLSFPKHHSKHLLPSRPSVSK